MGWVGNYSGSRLDAQRGYYLKNVISNVGDIICASVYFGFYL